MLAIWEFVKFLYFKGFSNEIFRRLLTFENKGSHFFYGLRSKSCGLLKYISESNTVHFWLYYIVKYSLILRKFFSNLSSHKKIQSYLKMKNEGLIDIGWAEAQGIRAYWEDFTNKSGLWWDEISKTGKKGQESPLKWM